jgi:hypothetical protein
MKMRFPLIAALAVIVSLAACSDMPTAFAPDEVNLKAAQPSTAVGASFTIGEAGSGWQNWDDAPRIPRNWAADGQCTEDGTYTGTNPGGQFVTEPLDEKCGEPINGEAVTLTLSGIIANFVQPRSGNLQLNFTVCGYAEEIDPETGEGNGVWVEDCDADKYVHFQRPQDVSRGVGAVVGVVGDDVQWIVFLSSSSTNRDGNAFSFDAESQEWSVSGLSAKRLDGTLMTQSAVLSWSAPKAW